MSGLVEPSRMSEETPDAVRIWLSPRVCTDERTAAGSNACEDLERRDASVEGSEAEVRVGRAGPQNGTPGRLELPTLQLTISRCGVPPGEVCRGLPVGKATDMVLPTAEAGACKAEG